MPDTYMRKSFKPWLILQLAVLLVGAAFALTSCGSDDDEPKGTVVDYYVNVGEVFLVNGSTNTTTRYQNPVNRLNEAIRKVYPTPNAQGADEAVVAACDAEYTTYREMYTGLPDHLTGLFTLVRVVKQGTRIKQSEDIRIYVYDINPTPTHIDD